MTVSSDDDERQAGNGLSERSLSAALADDQRAVLDFWLGDGLLRGWPRKKMNDRWFGADVALDKEIGQRFGGLVDEARMGELNGWQAAPLPHLSLVILLDQFTRNIFRGRAAAYSGDNRAQELVRDALRDRLDQALPWVGRVFLYMPLMHAENLALQHQCVRCFEQLLAEAPAALHETLQGNLRFAKSHLDIIERFGRFPYRNAVLERSSSAAERNFFKSGPRFGQ